MGTEIYYFSGTGNSLFVARELQKRIPDSVLIPIVSLLHKEVIQTNGKTIGIVFPCHALTIPVAVKRFIRRLEPRSAEYIFAVATRYGTVFRGFAIIEKLLRKKNKHLNAQFILNMCHNEAPRSEKNYAVPSKSAIHKIEKNVLARIDQMFQVIEARSEFREKDSSVIVQSSSNPLVGLMVEQFVGFAMNISEYIGGVNYFYHDKNCNGCGICERVCLSSKIKIIENEPRWQKNVLCYMCFACLNYCPKHSVQIKDIHGVRSYTTENERYPHPYATINDISAQKEQR